MTASSLMVMVPTRGRKEQCERLLKSFRETTDNAEISFILDPDDLETYEGTDWGGAPIAVLDPRGSLTEKLNHTASALVNDFDALMFTADDQVFRTPHWDTTMLNALEKLGGSGWVYPDDKRRNDVPEHYLASADIVKALGWFANPAVKHYRMDDSVAYLGKKSGLLGFVPEVVIEHHHYSVDREAEHDRTYSEAEETWGQDDHRAFYEWVGRVAPFELALLRRTFNKDVHWVLDRVGA